MPGFQLFPAHTHKEFSPDLNHLIDEENREVWYYRILDLKIPDVL
jgi:hypothetical protein